MTTPHTSALFWETIVDPVMTPQGVDDDDIRGDGPKSYSRSAYDSLGAGSAEAVATRFRPLSFGAAYKVLDFVVEMTMRLNGEPCPKSRWRFQEKAVYLARGRPARLPAPFDAVPDLWDRAAQLYTVLDEHRHALVHRRARVEANGDFTGCDRAGAPLRPITTAEMDALSRAALALARSIISASSGPRDVNLIAWDLNALDDHHAADGSRQRNHPARSFA